jgi:hypothetical protein
MPDANIAKLSDRLSYAEYWKNEKIETETLIARDPSIVDGEAFRKYVKIREFAHNVSDMLEHLVDKLMPRDLERMAAEGFREVLEIVTGPPKR